MDILPVCLLVLFVVQKKPNDPEPLTSTPNSIIFKVNGEVIKIDNLNSLGEERVSFAKQLKILD